MRRLAGLAMLGALWASAATRAQAPAEPSLPAGFDLRAKDAVDMFAAMCVSTRADRARALAAFGAGNPIATRLSDDQAATLQHGRTGGVAWIVQSPHGAQFLLEYDPVGLCGVRLREGDEHSVEIAFGALARAAATVAHADLTTAAPQTREQDGAKITLEHYSFPWDGRTADLILSASDRKVAAQQDYMTLTFSKPGQ